MSNWNESVEDHRSRQADRIMHSAGELLTERGLSGLNMRALAEAAGVSRPTLYKYFSDVDSVLVALADSVARQAEADLEEQLAGVDAADDKLRVLVRAALHGDEHGHETVALHWALTAIARDVLQGHQDRMTDMIAQTLTQGIASGEFRGDLDVEIDARFVRGAIGAIQESVAAGEDPEHIAAVAERTILLAVAKRRD